MYCGHRYIRFLFTLMAVQTLLLSPTAAIQNIVMLTELVVVAFVAFLHLFSSLWLSSNSNATLM